jgi:PAS domain S-box-containing protein
LSPRAGEGTGAPFLEDRDEDLYEDAPCGYLSLLPDGTIVRVNRTFESWTGRSRADLLEQVRLPELLTAGGRIYFETHCGPLLHMQGEMREIALEIRCADGGLLPVLVNAVLRRSAEDQPDSIRLTVFDASDRRAYERELLRGRERAERLQRHNALLAEASRVLDAEQGARARIGALLDLLVREFASEALVGLAGENEPIRAGDPPGSAELAEVLQAARAANAPRLRGAKGERAHVAVPLVAQGQQLGVLAVALPGDGEAEPPQLVEAIADRAAVAVANARLLERERETALVLQRAMLPQSLLEDGRCDIAAHYAAAVDTLEVGGDWYDAFCGEADRIVLVVGDVVGKGLEAAATMGQLRSALRTLAMAGMHPAQVLEHLDSFVDQTDNALAATLVLVDVDLSTGAARLACAGHPPPILVPPQGDPRLIWGGRSPPLGIGEGSDRREAVLELKPASRLLLYSDGAVERRDRDIDVGIDRLMKAFASRRDDPLEEAVGSLQAEHAAGGDDDVCLLGCAFQRFDPSGG